MQSLALATSRLRRLPTALRRGFTTTPCGTTTHPLIDISPLFDDGDSPERAAAVSSIGAAMRTRGYFYCVNVDALPADYIASVYEYSRRLHSLPLDVKKAFSQRGSGSYTGEDIGEAELEYEVGVKSSARAWDYSRTMFSLGTAAARYPAADVIEPPFEAVLGELYERQNTLARGLLGAFGEALGLPRSTFVEMFEHEHLGTVRLIHYPGRPTDGAPAAEKGIGAHTDFEAFTLMHQDAPGLQFMPRQGEGVLEWVDAPVRRGEFVVIVGDMLERFTNGTWRATPHRVLQTDAPRSSIIRFNAVAPQTVVEPLSHFVSDAQPPLYSPVTMQTHMETTMRNIDAGLGAWDDEAQRSTTASYLYIDGRDHRLVERESA